MLAALLLTTSLATSSVSSATPRPPAALPGQATMSADAVDAALAGMTENERDQMAPKMKDPSIRPLAYKTAYYKVVTEPDGEQRIEEVDPALDGLTASIDGLTAVTETGRKYDLYMSQYVGRTSTTGTYEYLVETYFDWRAGNSGMNAGNCAVDLVGVAWGGGELSQGSRGTQSGKYINYLTGERAYNLDIERWDVVPNVGMEYRFHEWREAAVGCSGAWKIDYGRASLYLRKSTYSGKLTTIVSKYFHTYATHSYSLNISATPSVTISPAQDYWPFLLSQDIKV